MLALLAGATLGLVGCDYLMRTIAFGASAPQDMSPGLALDDVREEVRVVATGLEVPWELRWLPDGDLLVTERPGRLLRLSAPTPDGQRHRLPAEGPDDDTRRRSLRVPGVVHAGEGGLMGLAVHAEYPERPWIYLCHTFRGEGGLENRVVRYTYTDHAVEDPVVILGGMPGNAFHDGCRLEFGPDGMLYVTMGDAGAANRAQDSGSLSGKILRVAPDGSVPEENPFGNAVYSYGHRNPQGLAWDSAGRMWSTEHGPSGFSSGFDELNLIEAGANYGWPRIRGDEEGRDMRRPVLHSGSESTWAPAGLAYLHGSLFYGGLRGQALYQVAIPPEPGSVEPGGAEGTAHFYRDLGRIRVVRVGPDGALYLGTSNRDGRGDPRGEDDRILCVEPGIFTGGIR